jgi:Golgi phosphoprotein 3 (GPP34)
VHPVAGVDPPEEPLLERKLALVAEKERTAQDLVGRLGKGMRQELLEDLAERGVVRRDHERVFGLFSVDRWPAVDSAHEARVRELLSSALLHGTTPDQRSAALISLLAAVDHAHKVIETHDVPTKEIRKRAKQIAEGEWAAKAVRDAVQAVQSAMVAVLVTTTVVTAGGT